MIETRDGSETPHSQVNAEAYERGRRDARRFLAMSPPERDAHLRAREEAGEDVRIERGMETASREELLAFAAAVKERLGLEA